MTIQQKLKDLLVGKIVYYVCSCEMDKGKHFDFEFKEEFQAEEKVFIQVKFAITLDKIDKGGIMAKIKNVLRGVETEFEYDEIMLEKNVEEYVEKFLGAAK